MTDSDTQLAVITGQLQTMNDTLKRVEGDILALQTDLKPSGLYVTRAEWNLRTVAIDREVTDIKKRLDSMKVPILNVITVLVAGVSMIIAIAANVGN